MPRKAPDKVIEHRISLSNYERKYLDEAMQTYQAKIASNSITNLIGSLSIGTLGWAALIWVGFSLDDAIEKAKGLTKEWGYKAADWLTQAGFVNYTADEIGRAIQENDEALAANSTAYHEYLNSSSDPQVYSSQKAVNFRKEAAILQNRDTTLRKMLDQITRGEVPSYGVSWMFQQPDHVADQESTAEILQTWYEYEGGEGQVNWDIDESQN